MTRVGVEGFKAEVVKNKQFCAAERFEEARIATIAARKRKFFAEPWPAMIQDRTIVPTSLLTNCAGEPAFTNAAWTNQRDIIMRIDPIALGKFLEERSIKTA